MFAASKEQMNMVDPKQGPFHPKRTEACVDPSCHLPTTLSTNNAPEAERAGEQPFASNRQTRAIFERAESKRDSQAG